MNINYEFRKGVMFIRLLDKKDIFILLPRILIYFLILYSKTNRQIWKKIYEIECLNLKACKKRTLNLIFI